MKKVNTESFIEKAKQIHGDRYDYSKVVYNGAKEDVVITCKIHGDFKQKPTKHLTGHNCPLCAQESRTEKQRLNVNEFIERSKQIHGDKYDYSKVDYVTNMTKVKIICKKHGEFEQFPLNHMQGKGCPECGKELVGRKSWTNFNSFVEKAIKVHGDVYKYREDTYHGTTNYVDIICPKHGCFKQNGFSHLKGHGCPKCFSVESKEENEIYNYIKKILPNQLVIQHYRGALPSKREIDIFIPSLNIGIEFNGLRWHSELYHKEKDYHLSKTIECEENGIKLIQIFEDEFDVNKEIVFNKLSHLCKVDVRKPKIMARKCIVTEISSDIAKKFLDKYHIQNSAVATVHLGAFFDKKLIGVMSFVKEKNNSWNLTRFATNYNFLCQGVGGKLFKFFIKKYNPEYIKSFADRRWTLDSKDNIYIKLGFKLENILKPDYRYYDSKSNEKRRIHKFNCRKQVLNKKFGLSLSLTEKEMCDKLEYYRVWDCGLLKYVWEKKRDF